MDNLLNAIQNYRDKEGKKIEDKKEDSTEDKKEDK